MAVLNLVTADDLETFKESLLESLSSMLADRQTAPARKWLKSHEVRRLLTVSPNTLFSLREKGLLPYTKIGGVIYYDYEDIRRLLETHKVTGTVSPVPVQPINSNKSKPGKQL